MERTKELEGKI